MERSLSHRAGCNFTSRLIDRHDHAVPCNGILGHRERSRWAFIAEQALPRPDDDGIRHHAHLVDDVTTQQRLDQITTAPHVNIATIILFQTTQVLVDITFDES